MSNMFESRAQAIGVKPKVLIARTKKQVAEIRSRILALAYPWGEIDESIVGKADTLLTEFDEFMAYVKATETWLNEQLGS